MIQDPETPPAAPPSLRTLPDARLWMVPTPTGPLLAVQGESHVLQPFEGTPELLDGETTLLCPQSPTNARALRQVLPNLSSVPLGLETSAGFGDRLGRATPGHVQALLQVGGNIQPVFAQQSIREMTRTGRTPQQVLDDATWGAFQAGWQGKVGADADHLKGEADIDRCAEAGFSFYTLDPSAHVDNQASFDPPEVLKEKFQQLSWQDAETSPEDLRRRLVGKAFDLGHRNLILDEAGVVRAAVKYLPALLHVRKLFWHLQQKNIPFELEISVDETNTPTTPLEHLYMATELKRLGVRWVSLAPRFVGAFEKGVDYIGDLGQLEREMQDHAHIARLFGPYKLSLHSGSDKFTVYPIAAQATGGRVHLKTAGTSYLEALRVVASCDPDLFRQMLEVALAHFEEDRKSYHISAQLQNVPTGVPDPALLLDQFDARQVLHVTFGTVLGQFREPLFHLLDEHEDLHHRFLKDHFVRHLAPFVAPSVEA